MGVASISFWFSTPASSLMLPIWERSEEHTSELQSQSNLVCRLLLEKTKTDNHISSHSLARNRICRDLDPPCALDLRRRHPRDFRSRAHRMQSTIQPYAGLLLYSNNK